MEPFSHFRSKGWNLFGFSFDCLTVVDNRPGPQVYFKFEFDSKVEFVSSGTFFLGKRGISFTLCRQEKK